MTNTVIINEGGHFQTHSDFNDSLPETVGNYLMDNKPNVNGHITTKCKVIKNEVIDTNNQFGHVEFYTSNDQLTYSIYGIFPIYHSAEVSVAV